MSAAAVSVHDEEGVELLRVPVADIRSARTEPLVGGARLELTTTDGIVPVAECTAIRRGALLGDWRAVSSSWRGARPCRSI